MPYPSLEEMKRLANELLSAPEGCLPWEPIPAHVADVAQVNVTHVAEDYGEGQPTGENLTIAIAAFAEATETAPREEGAWRIDFTGCGAYRKRIINYVGSAPLTRPDLTGVIGTAFWEIAGSHYFVESGVWGAHDSQYFHQRFHHYVIVSATHTVHEVIASGWRCTPLPQQWAQPFVSYPMPKWPPAET